MANRFGRLALHMWTIDTTPLATALDAARAAGYDAVELRRIDFKRCYEAGMSNPQVLDLVRKSGIPVGVLGVEYGWLFAKGEDSKRIFGVFRESCENAVALGCGMLMSAPGPFVGTVAEAIANLKAAGDIAAEFGLRLAIEFNSQHQVLNNLAVQREIVGGAAKKNVGLLLDAYHLARSGAPGRASPTCRRRTSSASSTATSRPTRSPASRGRPTGSRPARARCAGARCSACSPRRATPGT